MTLKKDKNIPFAADSHSYLSMHNEDAARFALTTTVSTLGGAEAIERDLLRALTPLFPLQQVFESSLARFVLSAVSMSNVTATSGLSKGCIPDRIMYHRRRCWSTGTLFIIENNCDRLLLTFKPFLRSLFEFEFHFRWPESIP
jgi:hypothetical protein